MATETEEADLTGEDLRYISEAARIRAAMDRAAAVQEKRQQEAAARADYQAARMEAAEMRKAGKSDLEITRALGPRLYTTPKMMFDAERAFAPKPPVPTGYVTNLPGLDRPMIAQPSASGATTYKPVPPPIIEKSAPMPLDVKAQQDLRKSRVDSLRSEVNKGRKGDITNQLQQAEQEYIKGSTNYPGYKPNAPQGTSASQFRKQSGIVYQKIGDKWVPAK